MKNRENFETRSTSVQTLAAAWDAIVTDYGRTAPDAEVADDAGLALRWADSLFAFWNCIIPIEQDIGRDTLMMQLERGAVYMGRKRQPGYIWIFENLLTPAACAALPTMAKKAGLAHGLVMYDMLTEKLIDAAPTNSIIEVQRMRSADELTSYADINAEAYGMPLSAGRDGLEGSELWLEGMHSYFGMAEGRPVSTAATCAVGKDLFLALVATRPAFQRRGFGEAAVRAALSAGSRASDWDRMVLHATAAGKPLYERLGFRAIGKIQAYTLAR